MKIRNKNLQFQAPILNLRQFFIIALFFIGQITHSNSNEELFLQGNDYFLKGNFNNARNCYEQILEKSSAVWHNMGNCFFNEKNNIKAIICWKRAERDANFNQLGKLFESENKAFEQLHCSSDSVVIQKIKQLFMSVSIIQLQLMLLIFLLLFLYLWYYCFVQSRKSFYLLSCKKKYMIALLLGIAIIIFILSIKEKYLHRKEAIVIQEKVSVYIGPEITFSQKATLSLGCIVQILEEKQNMFKIIYPQGSGWVSSDNIEIL